MRVKLGECVEQIRGVSYKPEDLHDSLDSDSVVLLRANNIKDGQLNFDDVVYVDKTRVKNSQLLKRGDILVCASSGSKDLVGKAAYVDKDMTVTFGAFCKVVRPKTNTPKYIAHYFQSPIYRQEISNLSSGANINNIRNEHIDELLITLPGEDIQIQIVDLLDKVSVLLALRKKQLSKLDELVKSRFIEMFGEFIQLATPVNFESICEFVTVGIANSATHAFCDDGVIMFRNQNIKEDYLDTFDIVHITPDFASKYKSKMLKKDDLLIVRTGYPGVACLVPKKYEGCQTFTTLIARIKHDNTINPRFVCHYINSEYGKKYVRDNSAGAAQQNFGATALSKLPICIPPIELQVEYIEFVGQTDKLKSEIKESLEKLETLKKSLMQKYFG